MARGRGNLDFRGPAGYEMFMRSSYRRAGKPGSRRCGGRRRSRQS